MTSRITVPLLLAALVLTVAPCLAAPRDVDIAQLAERLNSDKFSQRQSATEALRELGKTAFPALADAARSLDREAASRAVEILKHHLKNGDAATQDAARKTLEALVSTDHALASRLARYALQPEQEPHRGGPGIQWPAPQVAQFQIQVNGINNNNVVRRMQVRIQNGAKQINVSENGRDIEIQQAADGSIKMQVTEKLNGQNTRKKYEAKNADDLKQNHPEAHQIFQQHAGGNIQIQQRAPFGLPVPVPAPQNALQPPFQNNQQQIGQSKQRLDDMIKQYRGRIEQAEAEIQARQKSLQDNAGDAQAHQQTIDEKNKEIASHRQVIENLEKGKASLDGIQQRIDEIRKQTDLNRADLERRHEELKRQIEERRQAP